VEPVARIPLCSAPSIPQILINKKPVGFPNVFDAELLGDCDQVLVQLAKALGWESSPSFNFSQLKSADIKPPTHSPPIRLIFEGADIIPDFNDDCDNDSYDSSVEMTEKCSERLAKNSPAEPITSENHQAVSRKNTTQETVQSANPNPSIILHHHQV